jgi:hypothetical protein
MKNVKNCILDDEKVCNGCGECDMCDLDPKKKCDNCCKCIEDSNRSFASIVIDEIHLEDGKVVKLNNKKEKN